MYDNLWLGTHASYEAVLEAKANALAKYGDNSDEPEFSILKVQGNVGIINVRGSLVNGNAGWMCYFGVTGYGDIRDAMVQALKNAEVSAILLNIDSGGGAVAGVHETAQLIARVDKLKPVFSYTGGTEASAALWLGSSARKSYAAETSLTGSLGILMVHAERSKQLEQDGVKVTVIRAGSEKALANSYEPLSKEAKIILEDQAKAMYDIFLGHVAGQRGVSNVVADEKFGQGKVFVGKDAVTAGLMDAIGSLEDAYTAASKAGAKVAAKTPAGKAGVVGYNSASVTANMQQVSADSVLAAQNLVDNTATTEGTPMTLPLTPEQLAAVTAGVVLEAAAPTTETATTTEVAPAAETKPATEVLAGGASELVDYLKSTNASLTAEVVTLKMEAKTATDKLEALTPALAALAEIGRNSVRTMTVALGGKAESVATLSDMDVVAEHGRVSALFKEKFKVGAVAATNTSEDAPVAKQQVNPLLAYAAKSLSK